ncbi:MAG TPA: shikimate dehydrogenase [Chloroflexota bacterium]
MSHRWACLFGHPVAHSLSPTLHNAAFQALGVDAHYEARDVDPELLGDAVQALREPACYGANVTAPHKQAIMALLDALTPEVRALGAVNTVVNQGGRLTGGNTDGPGLARWMSEVGIEPRGRPALVVGAGGAARSAVWALATLGASRIHVVNRTLERARQVQADLAMGGIADLTVGALHEVAEHTNEPWGVIVNATSLGHHGAAPDVHPSCYSPQSVAIELAYNPPETGFMRAAQAAGARAENGLGMLVHQAALSFERWTGRTPPLEVMFGAVADRIGV